MLRELAVVAVGGGCGSALRHLVSVAATRWAGESLPWGTLTVNLVGSFALAALTGLLASPDDPRPTLRLLVAVGLLGGFTTYSTFNLDVLRLLQQGRSAAALGYATLTLGACLLAGAAGLALSQRL